MYVIAAIWQGDAGIEYAGYDMPQYQIDFQPLSRRATCTADRTLLDCAHLLGLGLLSICGGKGDCEACKVQIIRGRVSKPTSLERKAFSAGKLKQGWRLACQAYPASDCTIKVPAESLSAPQRTQIEGLETAISPEPAVRTYKLQMQSPADSDLRADADRLLQTLNQQYHVSCSKIDIEVLRELPPELRSGNREVQVSVREGEVIALSHRGSKSTGLAVDLGSTKIAGYLIDLGSGRTLAARGISNPQSSYGDDIISRISLAVKSPGESKRLQELAVDAINHLAGVLCEEAGSSPEEIVDSVIGGNTAMHHLLLGLPVRQLALVPYVPAVKQALDIKARDAGLQLAPGAYVHLLPNIAGFVGGDHVAALLATEAEWTKGLALLLDIGTNTEVSLIGNGEIISTSCASGPAFEGGHIRCGMKASSGAIERLRFADGIIQYQTIDGGRPSGICGSGILDAIAQLYLTGILDRSGRMSGKHPYLRTSKGKKEFVIIEEKESNGNSSIVITQQDIRELQLAKSAIRTGIQMLLEAKEKREEELERVIIAGAFGSYIDVESAIVSGMLPFLPLERFRQVGNAAGMGTRLALVSASKRTQAQAIASRVYYLELSRAMGFRETFLQASYLGRYRLNHGKRMDID